MPVYATPDPGKWVVEHIIGETPESYYFYEYAFEQEGTYYEHTESIFIIEREHGTGKERNRIKLRTVKSVYSVASDMREEILTYSNDDFKLDYSLLGNIFPSDERHTKCSIQDGMIVVTHGSRETRDEYVITIPIPSEISFAGESTIIDVLAGKKYLYFIVEYGHLYYDGVYNRRIIPVLVSEYYGE